MSQWSLVKKPNWVGDGKDVYSAGNILATEKGWVYTPSGEVLVAIRALTTKNGDVADAAVVPTFTAAVSYSGTLNTVTGDIVTVTLTASEPVAVSGTPTIDLVIGANTRQLTYDSINSTDTSLVFTYEVVAGDSAPLWQINTLYSIGDKFLQGSQWYEVATGYTSGSVFDNLLVSTVGVDVGGSGFQVSTTKPVTFTGGTEVVAATAEATIDASGAVTAINVLTGGEYSVAPTGVSVESTPVAITSASWLADVATIVAPGHGFLTGYSVTIAGMDPIAYNGTYSITVIDVDTFTYALIGDPGATVTTGTATSVTVEPTVTITTAAIDTPNLTMTTQQVTVAALTIGGVVSDIMPSQALVTASVTFTAPDTSLTTAN